MGKPKFSRKKYVTPSHPWQETRIKAENELIKKYGLKNKREIWKAQTRLRKYRSQARELLAKVATADEQSKKESDQLLMHLSRMNMLPDKSTLDDVLALEIESILGRRLQTLTYLKGLSNTPEQSRQLISHGHIAIGNNRVTVPSYLVTKNEESDITYTTDSPLNDTMHPARPRAEYKGIPIKKEIKQPDEKPTEPQKEEKADEKTSTETTKEEPEKETEEKSKESQEQIKGEKTDEQPQKQEIPKPKEEPKESEKPEEKPVEQNKEKTEENKNESDNKKGGN